MTTKKKTAKAKAGPSAAARTKSGGNTKSRADAGANSRAEKTYLMAVLDGIDDVIYVSDVQTYNLLYVNDAFRRIWGEGSLGKKCYRVLQGRDAPCPFCTNDKILGEYAGKSYVWEFRNEATKRWFRCSDKAISWVDGRTARFELASDITDLKTAERQIREEQAKVSAFLDNTTDLVTVVNPDGTLRYVNQASKAIFGLKPDEALGRTAFDFIHPDDRRTTYEAFLRWLEEGVASASWENRQVSAAGEVHDMLWTIMPKYEDGRLESIWSIARDITERKRAEQALARKSRVTDAVNAVFREALSCETEEAVALANKAEGFTDEDRETVEVLAASLCETLVHKRLEITMREQSLLKAGQAEISEIIRGEPSLETLCRNIITFVCGQLDIPAGLIYIAEKEGTLLLKGSYAYTPRGDRPRAFGPGDGLVGQAALEKKTIHIKDVPAAYIAIESGLGQMPPSNLYIIPLVRADRVRAVLELGTLAELTESQMRFLIALTESIAFAVEDTLARDRQAGLLDDSQRL